MTTTATARLDCFCTRVVRLKASDGTLYEFRSAYSLDDEKLYNQQNSYLNFVHRAIIQSIITADEAIPLLDMTTNAHGDWILETFRFMDDPTSMGPATTYMDFKYREAYRYGYAPAQLKKTMQKLIVFGLFPAPNLD
jgi:hypothetical protein